MRISDWSSDVCSSDLPIDEGAKGLVPGLTDAWAGGQEREAVVEPLVDLGERERAGLRRSQLQRERQPVESTDDALHECGFVSSDERRVGNGGVRTCRSRV